MGTDRIRQLQEKYTLTKEEYEAYCDDVKLYLTSGKTKVERPKLIIVAGQPGAGKSKLLPLANEDLKYDSVIVDTDVTRTMHPRYKEAKQAEDEKDIHLALLQDCNRLNFDMMDYCRGMGLNFIYEGTMRGTEGYLKMARDFRTEGYDILLYLMAVPKLESYGSTLLRYATDILQNNNPRFITRGVHDECYEKMLVTIQRFLDEGLYDEIRVFKRGIDRPILCDMNIGEQDNSNPIQLIQKVRDELREKAILDYEMKHRIVTEILCSSNEELLKNCSEWEDMYQEEVQYLKLNKGEDGR